MKIKNRYGLFLLLLFVLLAFAGCGGEEDITPTGTPEGPEATGAGNLSPVPGGTEDEKGIVILDGSVTFSSEQSFVSFLKVRIDLPEGISPADIDTISFDIESDRELELRLYAGAEDTEKTEKAELTHEFSEQVITKDGDVNRIETVITDSTRLSPAEGERVIFNVDGHAAGVLESIQGSSLVLGIYDNNVAPSFSVSGLEILAGDRSIAVVLDESTAYAAIGGTVEFETE